MKNNFKLKSLRYFTSWFLNPARFRRQTGYPTILNFPVTDNCNSRCVMCDVWKTKSVGELSAEEIRRILSDPLFVFVEHVGLSGGEPTLRADLPNIVAAIVESLPSLQTVSITSHGFHTARWRKFLPGIRDICGKRSIKFTLNLSLDGIGELHDEVRQIPGGYERVMETHRAASEFGVNVVFQTTVSSVNVHGMANLLETASRLGCRTDFRAATEIHRLDNSESMKRVMLGRGEGSFLADFLTSQSLMRKTTSPARRLFYRDLARRLTNNSSRKAPCYYQREGVLLTPHGDLYQCSISASPLGNVRYASAHELYFSEKSEKLREALIRQVCPGCIHDQSGAWTPLQLAGEIFRRSKFGLQFEKFSAGFRLLLKALPALVRLSMRRRFQTELPVSIKSVLCMGMYGGEHVGDAAILGGVLLRLRRRFGVGTAYVASFRPDRTRRWLDSLELPVRVIVIPLSEARRYIPSVGALVLAGGPVMDLPVILLQQIILLNHSIAAKIPFLVEGVGIGPLRDRITKWLVGLMFKCSASIAVRAAEDAKHALVASFNPRVDRDPAFDYLESRRAGPAGSAIDPKMLPRIEILRSKPGYSIGINLRPFWRKYISSGVEDESLEESFLSTFGNSLVKITQEFDAPVRYYFFPMNADQYGFSDIRIGHQLKRWLPPGFPLQVWEFEPGVDDLLRFIQKMDAVIAMRFHAAIFSLALNIPVLGIDYAVGENGKVTRLFEEMSLQHYVRRVDTFSGDWLRAGLLNVLSASNSEQIGQG